MTVLPGLDDQRGEIIEKFHQRHRAREFRTCLTTIDAAVPPSLAVHLIVDNASTHKTPLVHRWLVRHPRFHVHFTPTGSSWINLVERWFAALTEKQLRRGVHRSTRELETAIRRNIDITNERPKPLKWTKTADETLASVALDVDQQRRRERAVVATGPSRSRNRMTDVDPGNRPASIQDDLALLHVERPHDALHLGHLAAVVDPDLALDCRLELLAHRQDELAVGALGHREVGHLSRVRLE